MSPLRIFKHSVDAYCVAYILFFFCLQLLACYYLSHLYAAIFAILIIPFFCVQASFNHHHQHQNTFYSSILNRALELILGLQTGITSDMWYLHHVLGHHKDYLNQTLDSARWQHPVTGHTMNRVEFSTYNFINGFAELRRLGKIFPRVYQRYTQFRVLYYSTLLIGLMLFGWNFLIIFIIPSYIIGYYTIEATWYHHSGLSTDNHFEASMNNISKFYNLRTCNLGYHTAHHLKPAVHWSLLPKLHEEIKEKIPSHLIHSHPWHG